MRRVFAIAGVAITVLGGALGAVALADLSAALVVAIATLVMSAVVWMAPSSHAGKYPSGSWVAITVLLATVLGLGVEVLRLNDGPPDEFTFVVVPKGAIAVEFVAPGPGTEYLSRSWNYGDQVRVVCELTGQDGKRWYRLDDDYYMVGSELVQSPSASDRPPGCD